VTPSSPALLWHPASAGRFSLYSIKGESVNRRVVITGMGIVSPYGVGLEVFWDSVSKGVSGIGQITSFDSSRFTTTIGGEVKDFNPVDFVDSRKSLKYMTKATRLGVAAARLAVENSGLDVAAENPFDVGSRYRYRNRKRGYVQRK